jgi:hypothetical protein
MASKWKAGVRSDEADGWRITVHLLSGHVHYFTFDSEEDAAKVTEMLVDDGNEWFLPKKGMAIRLAHISSFETEAWVR